MLPLFIPFTKYKRPKKEKRQENFFTGNLPTAKKATAMMDNGFTFEYEHLATEEILLTISEHDRGDIAIRICNLEEEVVETIGNMILSFGEE